MRWHRSTLSLAEPLADLRAAVADASDLWDLRGENTRLREENERLRRWQSVALALDAENQRLKANLRWIPDPAPSYVTARVVADAGGVYAKAVLLSVGPNHGIRKGEIALDERGLVGRVTEVGARTARVLLITDLNSRIPVILETSRAHAILVGTNGARPRLLYLAGGQPAAGGRARGHQRRGHALPGQPAGRHGALHQPRMCPRWRRRRCSIGSRWCASSTTGWAASRAPEAPRRACRNGAAADGARRPAARHPAAADPRPAAGHRGAATRFRPAAPSLLMLLTETPLGIAGQATLLPAVTLACVYFWSLFRPAAMPPPVVFLIGLLLDLLGYLPLGVGVLTLLVRARPRASLAPAVWRAGLPAVWLAFVGVRRRRRAADLGADCCCCRSACCRSGRRCSRRC